MEKETINQKKKGINRTGVNSESRIQEARTVDDEWRDSGNSGKEVREREAKENRKNCSEVREQKGALRGGSNEQKKGEHSERTKRISDASTDSAHDSSSYQSPSTHTTPTDFDAKSDPGNSEGIDGCEAEESDQEVLRELQYETDDDDDDEDLIPTEENFLKSSTSVSGDDDLGADPGFGRPRSVHFEDEKWENGEYRRKDDSDNEVDDEDREKEQAIKNSWSEVTLKNRRQKQERFELIETWTKTNRKQELQPLVTSQKAAAAVGAFSTTSSRPQNIKSANRESVRELLRRRREEVSEILQQDNRRRINTVTTNEKPAVNDAWSGSSSSGGSSGNSGGDRKRNSRSVERPWRESWRSSDRSGNSRTVEAKCDARLVSGIRNSRSHDRYSDRKERDHRRTIHESQNDSRHSEYNNNRRQDSTYKSYGDVTRHENNSTCINKAVFENHSEGKRHKNDEEKSTYNSHSDASSHVRPEKSQHMSRSRSIRKDNAFAKNGYCKGMSSLSSTGGETVDGVVISKREYAMFKSLVGAHSLASDKFGRDNNNKKSNGRSKRAGSPKSGNKKRYRNKIYQSQI